MNRKKIPYLEFLPIIIIGLILFKVLDRIDSVASILLYLLNILQPFFWAVGIAYVINPMMRFFEKKLRINRLISILICYLIVLGMITAIITIVIPMIVQNVTDLLNNFNGYKDELIDYTNEKIINTEWYDELNLEEYINVDTLSQYIGDFSKILRGTLDHIVNLLIAFFGGLFKVVVGFVIAVYLLLDKDKFQKGMRRIIYSSLKEKQADKTILFFKDVNIIFSRYIIGKTIDSIIIGSMCFIGLLVLDVKYAALLAIIVGVTNMIPYFGPFIGMVPAIVLTVFYDPIKALWVAIFIFALQQFDGYFLGPKILGDSVGLSPFWIILGILVGGSLMGVLGMLLAVPVVAVLQLVVTRVVNRRLADKDLFIE
ncbi:MAG: AI-2E family transporter [Clostridia bacterium]|nr:AI-2E family transporter [Clostridia bacterium]